jgi:hypothetical protein
MPRFFFHVYNDETCLDDEGQELTDVEAARGHGDQGSAGADRRIGAQGAHRPQPHIAIAGQNGELVGDVSFGEAVAIRP